MLFSLEITFQWLLVDQIPRDCRTKPSAWWANRDRTTSSYTTTFTIYTVGRRRNRLTGNSLSISILQSSVRVSKIKKLKLHSILSERPATQPRNAASSSAVRHSRLRVNGPAIGSATTRPVGRTCTLPLSVFTSAYLLQCW